MLANFTVILGKLENSLWGKKIYDLRPAGCPAEREPHTKGLEQICGVPDS